MKRSNFMLWYRDRRSVAVRYRTIGYDTVQYGTIRFGTVRYGTVRYGTVRYRTERYGTIRYDTVRYGTIRYDTVRYGTIRYDTVRYGTIRHGTVENTDKNGLTPVNEFSHIGDFRILRGDFVCFKAFLFIFWGGKNWDDFSFLGHFRIWPIIMFY
jgi:hypothetical protein